MNLLLQEINCKYPKIDAVNNDKNSVGAKSKLKIKIITGTYLILIRHGKQQNVVRSSGFCDALCHKNSRTSGNHPIE